MKNTAVSVFYMTTWPFLACLISKQDFSEAVAPSRLSPPQSGGSTSEAHVIVMETLMFLKTLLSTHPEFFS